MISVYSNAQKIYRYKNGRTFKCAHCGRQFKVTTGTIYENSNIPLQKWFLTYYLISLSKKGISSIELSKAIGVTQKSAWYLLHKIRYMFEHRNSDNQLRGAVEVDETYVGGKKKGKRGRGSENKTPVFGAVQRKGRLSITPVENTKRMTLEPIDLSDYFVARYDKSKILKIYKHISVSSSFAVCSVKLSTLRAEILLAEP